jgi:hypothetical protein
MLAAEFMQFKAETPPIESSSDQAQTSWSRFMDRAKKLQGRCEQRVANLAQAGKLYVHSEFEFKQHNGCVLFLNQSHLDSNSAGTIEAINDQYAFKLQRSSPKHAWVLVELDTDTHNSERQLGRLARSGVLNWVSQPLNINGTAVARLPDLVTDPQFVMSTVGPGTSDAHISLNFAAVPKQRELKNELKKTDWMPFRKGRFILDSQYSWVLVECAVEQQLPPGAMGSIVYSTSKFQYRYGEDQFPIVTKISRMSEGEIAGTKMQLEDNTEFELYEAADIPIGEFTLTAFGLPEPPGIVWNKPTPWYVWLGGAAILLIVIAAGFKVLKRRYLAAD